MARNQKVKMKKNKSGSYKIWWDEYDTAGVRHQRSKTKPNFREAEAFRRETVDRLRMGMATKENITVEKYLEEFMESSVVGKMSPATEDVYAHRIKKYIVPTLGQIKLRELRPAQIRQAYNTVLKQGLTAGTVSNYFTPLKAALTKAYQDEILTENPMNRVAKLTKKDELINKKAREVAQIPTLEQAIKIMDYFKDKDSHMYIPVVLAIYTGIRREEIAALTWNDIDLEKGIIYIDKAMVRKKGVGMVVKETKTESSTRAFVIPPSLVEILRQHKIYNREMQIKFRQIWNKNDHIWISPEGQPLTIDTMSDRFTQDYRKLRKLDPTLPHTTFHKLRGTNSTLMDQVGVSDKARSVRLGHANPRITNKHYTAVPEMVDREVANKLDTLLNQR